MRNFVLLLFVSFFFSGSLSAQVWPGDVNNNGVVNGVDLLYLGTVYGNSGPMRAEENTDWAPQPIIEAWGSFFPNGVNHAFADCNGDGVVNDDDIDDAIKNNLGQTHAGSGLGDFSNGLPGMDVPIELSPSLSFDDGDLMLTVDLLLGNEAFEVEDFYGLALQLSYTSTFMEESSFEFELTEDSWIDGPDGENSAVLFADDEDNGKAELAITLIDPSQRRVGKGRIGQFSIVMEDIIVGLIQDTINIQIDSVTVINPEISKTAIVPDTLSLILSEDLLIISNEVSSAIQPPTLKTFPNPNQGQFWISAEEPIESIRIYNLMGQEIPFNIQQTDSTGLFIELPQAPPGTYVLTGQTAGVRFTTKVVLSQ
ncbi:MAG: T9SS type A sorting domain-containing protein [Saprospiraceae bacterium]|nr:T9SS type A sorting domain-containing protein [Saprospiraceae bacterium]